MERERQEHLDWCKQRAHEYLDRGDAVNAVTSMMSDLQKHSAWRDATTLIGSMTLLFAMDPTPGNARKIIDGFN
jgi:hypothetical protein